MIEMKDEYMGRKYYRKEKKAQTGPMAMPSTSTLVD